MTEKERRDPAEVLKIAHQYDTEQDTWATDIMLKKVFSEKNPEAGRFSDFFSTEESLKLALDYLASRGEDSRGSYVKICEAIGDEKEIVRRLKLYAEHKDKIVGTLGPRRDKEIKKTTEANVMEVLNYRILSTKKDEKGEWKVGFED